MNTQAELDRTFRTVVKAEDSRNKKLLFLSCLNIDIFPQDDQLFPLTKGVPWTAYLQDGEGGSRTMEQPEIVDQLLQQSTENPGPIDMESAIRQMIEAQEIRIVVWFNLVAPDSRGACCFKGCRIWYLDWMVNCHGLVLCAVACVCRMRLQEISNYNINRYQCRIT